MPVVPAPEWFVAALAAPRRTTRSRSTARPSTTCAGARAGRPGIVLVHGGAAHAHWWDHVAPLLAQEYCVVALDLSGHGDSGRRDRYPTSTVGSRGRRGRRARGDRGAAHRRRAQHGRLGRDHCRGRARRPARRASSCWTRRCGARRRRSRPRPRAWRSGRCAPTRRSRTRWPGSAPSPTSRPRSPTCSTTSRARRSAKVEDGWTWKFDPRIFDRPGPDR